MYTSIITKAEKAILQEDGSMFIDVEFDIMDDEEVIDTKRLAFTPDTTSDDILEQVKAYTANYRADAEASVVNAERDAELAEVDTTIEEIIGQEVTQ